MENYYRKKRPFYESLTSPVVIYIINSIGGRSFGKGNRFCTSSSKEIPVDHTSDRMVYSCPQIRSG